MKYDEISIKIPEYNLPQLEQLANGQCCRRYIYKFINPLPDSDILAEIAKSLKHRFFFDKEIYNLQEDEEIFATINIEKMSDREAKIIISMPSPEECQVIFLAIFILPRKSEEKLGTIDKIPGLFHSKNV